MTFRYFEVRLKEHSPTSCLKQNGLILTSLSKPASGYNFLSKKDSVIVSWQRILLFFISFPPGKVSLEQGLCDEAFMVFIVSSLLENISGRKLTDSEVLRPCLSLFTATQRSCCNAFRSINVVNLFTLLILRSVRIEFPLQKLCSLYHDLLILPSIYFNWFCKWFSSLI